MQGHQGETKGDKTSYYKALESADKADSEGTADVMQMEALLEKLLASQL